MFIDLTNPDILRGCIVITGAIFFLMFAIGIVLNCCGKEEGMAAIKISIIPFLAFVLFLVIAM